MHELGIQNLIKLEIRLLNYCNEPGENGDLARSVKKLVLAKENKE